MKPMHSSKRNERRRASASSRIASCHGRRTRRPRGFTLIEILVVIAIISLLMAIAMPALAAARERAEYARWQAYSHSLRSDPDMVVYYNFEQHDRGDALRNMAAGDPHDIKYDGDRLHGAIDTPDWSIDGRFTGKGALSFRPSRFQRGVTVSATNTNIGPGEMTLMGWVYCNPSGGRGTLASRWGSNGRERSWRMLFVGDDLVFEASTDGRMSGRSIVLADAGDYLDQWMHFAVTCDGNDTKLYLNGELHDSDSLDGDVYDNGEPIFIGGGGPNGRSTRLDGVIDEFALMKRALDADAIREHYRVGRP